MTEDIKEMMKNAKEMNGKSLAYLHSTMSPEG